MPLGKRSGFPPIDPDGDWNIDPQNRRMLHPKQPVGSTRIIFRLAREASARTGEEERGHRENENYNRVEFFHFS
jgi:hypothetical protein